jgi:hypothetical protein
LIQSTLRVADAAFSRRSIAPRKVLKPAAFLR